MPDGCAICGGPIEGPRLSGPETSRDLHPTCFAERIPADAIVALMATFAAVLVPAIVVWAG